jgi:hypothetical protein
MRQNRNREQSRVLVQALVARQALPEVLLTAMAITTLLLLLL